MTRKHLVLVLAIVLGLLIGERVQHLNAIAAAPKADVLIAYAPGTSLRTEWDAALRSKRVPHEWVSVADFGMLDGNGLAQRFALIVIPRTVARNIPDAARAQFERFAAAGGRIESAADPAYLR